MKQTDSTFGENTLPFGPLDTVAGFPVRPGMFHLNGATALQCGVNFTIHTHDGTSCELLLFRQRDDEPYAVIPFPESYKIGDVYSMIVFGLDITSFEYAYRVDGPYHPGQGYLFDRHKVLLDPYARAVAGQHTWGENNRRDYRARVVQDDYDWGKTPQPKLPISDLIIYELHVRGYTQDPSSGVLNRGTFAGLMEKVPYLKELGITAVELMPIFEFDETMFTRYHDKKKLVDYWGYNTVCFFAPNTSYASRMEDNREGAELKRLIHTLHENGIEVILDVVFNHTAEGNEKGPCFSFKGLDNRLYYMLTPDGSYYNFSGCGNTLNCNNPVVQNLILECLRHWTINYRVDGFRFDLASILGRSETGSPMNNPPLLRSLAYDPILSDVKLIAEAWDAGGMYQVGSFPASKRWAEWNGRYRDSVRGFLKGDYHESWKAAWSIGGSADLYGGFDPDYEGDYAVLDSCINFLTCHDGFTMWDLYSYNEKHNKSNGWDNTDGSNDNRSWNCGVEGPTDDPNVIALRHQMIRNACAVLLCSRGTPMFLAGDEFGNSQDGNNNCYCQDNPTSWLNWEKLHENHDLFDFFKFMIRFRKKHPVIRRRLPNAMCGMAPIEAHDLNAEQTNLSPDTPTFALSFAGYNSAKGRDDVVYLAINADWKDATITLPNLGKAGAWYLDVNTTGDGEGRYVYPNRTGARIDSTFIMRPRSVAIFTVRGFREDSER